MKKLKKPLGMIYKAVNALFWLLGGITACIAMWFYIVPQEGIVSLQQVITVLEKRLPQVREPAAEFLEFWQSYEENGTIENTMLRYYNPSPAGAIQNARVKLYHKSGADVYELLFEEAQPYLAAESSRDIFDIGTNVKIGNEAALCVEYADGRATFAPLSPERSNGMVTYRQSGERRTIPSGGCAEASGK